jgi:hypothetical protein
MAGYGMSICDNQCCFCYYGERIDGNDNYRCTCDGDSDTDLCHDS